MNLRIEYLFVSVFLISSGLFGQGEINPLYAKLKVQKVKYNNEGQAYFDTLGRMVRFEQFNNYSDEYIYDEHNRIKKWLLHRDQWNKKTKHTDTIDYFYDRSGKLIKTLYIYTDVQTESFPIGSSTEIFTYDSNGFLIRSEKIIRSLREQKIFVNGADSLADTIKTYNNISYQHRGAPEYDDTMRLANIVICFYDKTGKLVSEVPLKAENTMDDIKYSYEYDQNGNKLKEVKEQGPYLYGDLLKRGTITTLQYKYENQKLVELQQEEKRGDLITTSTSTYQYDDKGLLMQIKVITLSGKQKKKYTWTNKYKYVYFK